MRGWRVALLSLALLVAAGCGTPWEFTQLPTRAEFARPADELFGKYEQLARVESTGSRLWFVTVFDMPPAEGLAEAWGEPDHTRLSWWDLLPFALVPPVHPTTVWRWEIADKEVLALVDHPLALGYAAHVWTLKIVPREPDE